MGFAHGTHGHCFQVVHGTRRHRHMHLPRHPSEITAPENTSLLSPSRSKRTSCPSCPTTVRAETCDAWLPSSAAPLTSQPLLPCVPVDTAPATTPPPGPAAWSSWHQLLRHIFPTWDCNTRTSAVTHTCARTCDVRQRRGVLEGVSAATEKLGELAERCPAVDGDGLPVLVEAVLARQPLERHHCRRVGQRDEAVARADDAESAADGLLPHQVLQLRL